MTEKSGDKTLRSMTGFAARDGGYEAWTWTAEVRSVNGKGLDLRLRVPDWIEGLEAQSRSILAGVARRGNVTVSIRLAREDAASPLALNEGTLHSVLSALGQIEEHANAAGLRLAPNTAADIAQMRGVLEQSSDNDEDIKPLLAAILADLKEVTSSFDTMRRQEGAALHGILIDQLTEVSALTAQAAREAEARKNEMSATLQANLAKVLENTNGADPDRVAQELAMMAVKSDVTEEIDRLHAHVKAAHDLLVEGRAVGRKLDFLMQEFNREANTLCSKSQNLALTSTGLALKALIDQMREQVQNVE